MHILFLSDNFPPEVNAPATRTFEHCAEWVKLGATVTVVTCCPNFPKGKIYDGFKNKIWQQEETCGIRVIRVWTFIYPNEGFIGRILDYLSFMVTSFVGGLFVSKVDMVVGTSPQFFTVCSAFFISLCKRVPWVFEVRDLWPESIKAVGAIGSVKILRLLEKLELYLYHKADLIILVTNSFRQKLKNRGVKPEKMYVVTNGVNLDLISKPEKNNHLKDQLGLSGKFVIGYIGTHGMAHRLETIVEAALLIKNTGDSNQDIHFLFLGDGAEKKYLQKKVMELRVTNILFLDTVPKDKIADYLSMLDIGVVHLRKHAIFQSVIPSKIFEYMAAGVPILHGVNGESAQIVLREDVGVVFEPENSKDLVKKIFELKKMAVSLQKLSVNGRDAAQKYDRRKLARKMMTIFREVKK